jgi:hypothetical protein
MWRFRVLVSLTKVYMWADNSSEEYPCSSEAIDFTLQPEEKYDKIVFSICTSNKEQVELLNNLLKGADPEKRIALNLLISMCDEKEG